MGGSYRGVGGGCSVFYGGFLQGCRRRMLSIIARFYTRNIRSLIFQLKKEFSPRLPSALPLPAVQQPGSRPSLGKLAYPIFEDLTRDNFTKMRELADHPSVLSSWTVAGNLRYRLKNETTVRRVKSVFDSVEAILAQ